MKIRNQADVLHRLPCLVAHLIAESLGYFTPEAAANAIAYYTKGEAFSANGITTGPASETPRYYRLANWPSKTPSSDDPVTVARWPNFGGPWPSSFMFGKAAKGRCSHRGSKNWATAGDTALPATDAGRSPSHRAPARRRIQRCRPQDVPISRPGMRRALLLALVRQSARSAERHRPWQGSIL